VHDMKFDAIDAKYELPPAAIATLKREGWRIEARPPWVHVRPAGPKDQVIQGWKLHVSATVASAPKVLAACAPVLAEAGCEFKFARSAETLCQLNDIRAPRGMAGKFLTAYPPDEE